ncbi:hypothetical protein EVAR_100795_1 [Eumeta japonica]|uniref:Uncharacterized protein n=1 Tax=Eumeta variegata TaxID=151549 RepID=A0A4C1SNN2_EUMVA|nr:hypothetical protein EVAR_100795_1 [Eumeta japonica]
MVKQLTVTCMWPFPALITKHEGRSFSSFDARHLRTCESYCETIKNNCKCGALSYVALRSRWFSRAIRGINVEGLSDEAVKACGYEQLLVFEGFWHVRAIPCYDVNSRGPVRVRSALLSSAQRVHVLHACTQLTAPDRDYFRYARSLFIVKMKNGVKYIAVTESRNSVTKIKPNTPTPPPCSSAERSLNVYVYGTTVRSSHGSRRVAPKSDEYVTAVCEKVYTYRVVLSFTLCTILRMDVRQAIDEDVLAQPQSVLTSAEAKGPILESEMRLRHGVPLELSDLKIIIRR